MTRECVRIERSHGGISEEVKVKESRVRESGVGELLEMRNRECPLGCLA